MTRCGLALSILCCTVSASLALAGDFPYTGYINSDDVYVRSGPGKNYYPTDKLRQGEAVEVHRHDPGGWCAIRPPQRSFTWVPAASLDPAGDGLAEVREDRTIARVGSRFSELRDVIQVRLQRGESVEVLDSPPDGQWCKIAPPAGEFRWVHSKFVTLRDSERAEFDESIDEDGVDDGGDGSDLAVDGEGEEDSLEDEPDDDEAIRLASHEDQEWKRSSGRDRESEPSRPSSRISGSKNTGGELYGFELELSAILATEPGTWAFDDIRSRASAALEDAESPIERGRVRALLARIDGYEDLKRRHDVITSQPNASGRWGGASRLAAAEFTRFDASGVLMPAPAAKPGWPQYALYDAQGAVAALLTPAPGVNLRAYLNKTVGVQGSRGYIPEARLQHVQVQRIDELGGPVPQTAGRATRLFR